MPMRMMTIAERELLAGWMFGARTIATHIRSNVDAGRVRDANAHGFKTLALGLRRGPYEQGMAEAFNAAFGA
jgi:hypothetical protein